jgi:hypothetical protein
MASHRVEMAFYTQSGIKSSAKDETANMFFTQPALDFGDGLA